MAAAYFEDKLRRAPRTLYYAGCYDADDFARWIDDPGLECRRPRAAAETGAMTALGTRSIAGVAGALAGAS